MLLKINKEGPYKKDVFRAPGHQGNTRKLIHFLQQGKMVFFVRNGILCPKLFRPTVRKKNLGIFETFL